MMSARPATGSSSIFLMATACWDTTRSKASGPLKSASITLARAHVASARASTALGTEGIGDSVAERKATRGLAFPKGARHRHSRPGCNLPGFKRWIYVDSRVCHQQRPAAARCRNVKNVHKFFAGPQAIFAGAKRP